MKVASELADIEFRVGAIARQGDDLVIDSTPDSTLAARIVISPRDAVTTIGRLLSSPSAWGFLLRLPFTRRGKQTDGEDRDWAERRQRTGVNKPW
ncbi:MAG: hypothetical protein F4X81_02020 [Gammaproteobacteria bacterium]|nr:hypothetical protein [Gammaproteobacteria bacterium]MYE50226.1 hypothetical protein [Gammaproteobacteria bacterium]MYF49115.1 hypothetical protein [Gammaproteobacteria bacterium]